MLNRSKEEDNMSKHEYKIGDEVIIVANTSGHNYRTGDVVAIVGRGTTFDWEVKRPRDYCSWYLDESEITGIMSPDEEVKNIFSSLQEAVGMADPKGEPVKYNNVSKPAHYNHGGVECIDYIKQVLGKEGFVAYCRGNLVKYNHRAMYKGNPVEDLEKAEQYLKWANETLKEIHK